MGLDDQIKDIMNSKRLREKDEALNSIEFTVNKVLQDNHKVPEFWTGIMNDILQQGLDDMSVYDCLIEAFHLGMTFERHNKEFMELHGKD